jgi:hypothetical protein
MNQYAITYINEAGTFTRTDIVRAETIHSVYPDPQPGEVVYSIFLTDQEPSNVQG